MSRSLGLLLFSSLLGGCKHDIGSALDAAAERIVVIREASGDNMEQATYRSVLTITNVYDDTIFLKKIDFQGKFGAHITSADTHKVKMYLNAGESTEISLDSTVKWADKADFNVSKGSIRGTLVYKGPGGKTYRLPFSRRADVKVRGE